MRVSLRGIRDIDGKGHGRTVSGLVILVGLHGFEGSGAADELVGELSLVLVRRSILELLVVASLLRIVYGGATVS
jgi:hypothetical protein